MTGSGSVLGITKLVDNGRPEDRFNIVIVSEGYTKDNIGISGGFYDKAKEVVNALVSTPPFDELWTGMNIYRLDVISDQGGADDPICGTEGAGTFVNTYFDATFCGGGPPVRRRLTVDGVFLDKTVKSFLSAHVHFTLVIVDTTSGGSGSLDRAVVSSQPPFLIKWTNLVLHELSHSVARLADEYEYNNDCYPEPANEKYPGVEPVEPNVTTIKDSAKIKWRDWISSVTKLPTKANPKCTDCDDGKSPVPVETIGLFEGAHKYRCGVFRPRFSCLMRTLDSTSFCPVCSGALRRELAPFCPQPHLVVFHIDDRTDGNVGFYRIGWNLATDGNLIRGWHSPSEVGSPSPWFGNDSSGAGVAVADVDADAKGRPDLIVFHIDRRAEGNVGFYRIGWNLDVNGVVIGNAEGTKWSEPIAIDGWFGAQNQGAGVAVADVDGNGRPDLIVFHIDHPPGENIGYYRIGWNLDKNGTLLGNAEGTKWSEPIAIDGWFGVDNQVGGIAVADVDGNGRLDLIVFHIDHRRGGNVGFYRIGWNLDVNGVVIGNAEGTKWSEPIAIGSPDPWFGETNQGGGIAVADVDGNGRPDLIVFHIDHPGVRANEGFYRIGWNLGVNGKLRGDAKGKEWSYRKEMYVWFGNDNEGGDIALVRFG